jgi:branched-chain amino acid transport system permease protein
MLIKPFNLLNGPNTIGSSKVFWIIFCTVLICLFIIPIFVPLYVILNISRFCTYISVVLGLSLLWGYLGVLSVAQMAFFSIGGYTYGIVAQNLSEPILGTLLGLVIALLFALLVAALFGYFVFFSKISHWIIPILTLAFALILQTFMETTGGYKWKIGKALLGGYNGMVNIPTIFNFNILSLYYFLIITTVLIYLGLRMFVNSNFGYKIIAVRENSQKAEALGLNVYMVNFLVFIISAGLAAFSGVCYASWSNFMSTTSIGLESALVVLIWAAIGGKGSLTATLIMAFFLQYVSLNLSLYSGSYGLIIYGALLFFGIIFTPDGIIINVYKKYLKKKI